MRLILFLRIVGSLAAVLYNDYLNVGKESGVIPSNRERTSCRLCLQRNSTYENYCLNELRTYETQFYRRPMCQFMVSWTENRGDHQMPRRASSRDKTAQARQSDLKSGVVVGP